MSMKAHGRPQAIAAPLLRAALSDADATQLVGPAFRRATTVGDAEQLNATTEAIEIAELFTAVGFTAADFDRYVDAFSAPDPAGAFAAWADHETRPRVRRALAAALVAIEEER